MAKTQALNHVFSGAPMIPNLAKELTNSVKIAHISNNPSFSLDDA